ncbi:MAG TPA: DUF5666 domain-containing protein [Thermoanaerobaculia bacterium]
MRRSLVVVLTLFALSLSGACKKENSVTGPPSMTRTLTGQVLTVGDLAGSSPAGINVTSQGQVATTDAAGRFAFLTLPESNVQLTFTRQDGVNASATVGAAAGAVVVELERARAQVRVTGQSKREIEGLIVTVSDTSITVTDARTGGPVTAKIEETTVIRHGNRVLEPSDLGEGDRVHVRASIGANDELTALEIMLQQPADDDDDDGGDDGGQVKELEGPVTAISATSITVENASTHREETATINDDTVIRKGNRRLTTDDIPLGSRVHVKTNGDKENLVALEILLQN